LSSRGSQPTDLDAALLKARLKATLLGSDERVRLGRFQLLRSCGRGGEGVVYEALDSANGARVALKHLHRIHAAAGATLQQEFRALSRIVHPNLAVLYELFRVDAQWFYSMELLSGVDFLSAVHDAAERGAARPALRSALLQLLRGLSAIHAAGKIHRDLKPSNVLVEPDGRLVILDYGLMVAAPSGSEGQGLRPAAGTRAYMAPEQAAGARVTPAADLYAVGAMLFRALTNRPVMAATWAHEAKAGACAHAAPRPSLIARGVPADLDALCSALLERDPALRPTAEQALARLVLCAQEPERVGSAPLLAVAQSREAPVAPRPRPQECFVGRAAQLRALHAAFGHSLRGEAAIVLVHGESGIGKSTLLGRFHAELSLAADALLLRGRCYERENTPYKVFDSVVGTLVQFLNALPATEARALLPEHIDAVQRVFPAFSGLHAAPALAQQKPRAQDSNALCELAFSALRELLRRVRQRRPLVLIVDDLQWGDVDSIRLLQHLLSPPETPAMLIVGAYRRDELESSPFLQRALADGVLRGLGCRVDEVALDALPSEEAKQLVRAAAAPTSAWPHDRVDACVQAARGVPFLLLELAAHAVLTTPSADAQPRQPPQGTSLNEVVAARVARCSGGARALLDLLCIAGRPLELKLAARAAYTELDARSIAHEQTSVRARGAVREQTSSAHAAAAELCAAGLARWRDTHHERCLEPYHDLIRSAISAGVTEDRTRTAHGALARGMQSLAMDQPEQLFQHLLASGESARAGTVALVAAERAGHALAWLRAAEWFGVAIELLSDAEKRGRQIHEQLGYVLSHAGRHRAAARAFLSGVVLEPEAGRARLERLAAQQHLRAGDHAAASALMKKLLRQVGLRYPEHGSTAIAKYWLGRLRWQLAMATPDPRGSRDAASLERLATLEAFYAEHWLSDPLRALVFHTWFIREARTARDRHWLLALLWEVVQLALTKGQREAERCARLLARADALGAEPGMQVEQVTIDYARAAYLIHCRWRPRDALVLLRSAEDALSQTEPGSYFERGWIALLKDYALEITGNFSELVDNVLRRERECLGREDGYSVQQLLISLPLVLTIQDKPEAALAFLRTHWVRSERGMTLTDFVAILRISSLLLYQGDVRGAHESLLSEWIWLKQSGAFLSRVVYENASLHRARNAVALYFQTGAPELKREVQRRIANAERSPPGVRAFFRVVQASLARADGQRDECRALLEEACHDFGATQSDAGAALARYRLAQLNRSPAEQTAARDWLLARGICNLQRWVSLASPGPAEW
jgi:hypothetical protein